jgi:hypothetical protein
MVCNFFFPNFYFFRNKCKFYLLTVVMKCCVLSLITAKQNNTTTNTKTDTNTRMAFTTRRPSQTV